MRKEWTLFFTFLKIGAFTFGGGYAMLPMLQKEVVNGRHWATDEELMDYYAIGQCTPGGDTGSHCAVACHHYDYCGIYF